MDARYRLAVDTGGTFTDLCLIDDTSGSLAVAKVPSTPADPAEAVLAGVDRYGLVPDTEGRASSAAGWD